MATMAQTSNPMIHGVSSAVVFRDLLTLLKPNITLMSLLVAFGTMAIVSFHYHLTFNLLTWLTTLFGISLSVMGAGAFNMAMEWQLDAKMSRTKDRPIAAGRMTPIWGLLLGLKLSVLSVVILAIFTPPLTVALNAAALLSYVLIYTPLKQKTAWALPIGSVPGALPILMGSTALTGRIEILGFGLFLLLFVWQLPHFMAISIYRCKEYTKAGYLVAAKSLGLKYTRYSIIATTLLLLAVSYIPHHIGATGWIYASFATISGIAFLYVVCSSKYKQSHEKWARQVFWLSIVYQSCIFAALSLELLNHLL